MKRIKNMRYIVLTIFQNFQLVKTKRKIMNTTTPYDPSVGKN